VGGYASALPSNLLVVEILEDVPADPDVLKACRALKAGGCAIALDDIVTTAPPRGFLDLAELRRPGRRRAPGSRLEPGTAVERFPAYTPAARAATIGGSSSTSCTFRVSASAVNGFWRKAASALATPCRSTVSSVYPDM